MKRSGSLAAERRAAPAALTRPLVTNPTFRVSFCEWQTFAMNISAPTFEDAIAMARIIRDQLGTEPFDESDGASDGWDAAEVRL